MSLPSKPPPAFLKLPASEQAIVRAYWRSRGEGEMGAEVAFRGVRDDLEWLGAPEPLLSLAERAIEDEHRHGLWGRDFALLFGGSDESEPTPRGTKPLEFPGASPRDNRILRIAFCCFTETIGCHVLRDIRDRIEDELLRENNRQHLSDEVQHARACWAGLGLLDADDRALVRRYMPLLLKVVRVAFCDGPERDSLDHLVPFGYLTPRILASAYKRSVNEVIEPGLTHLHIQEAA